MNTIFTLTFANPDPPLPREQALPVLHNGRQVGRASNFRAIDGGFAMDLEFDGVTGDTLTLDYLSITQHRDTLRTEIQACPLMEQGRDSEAEARCLPVFSGTKGDPQAEVPGLAIDQCVRMCEEPEPLVFDVGQRVEVHGIGPKGWPELNGRRGRVTRRHGASDYRVLLDGDDPLNGVMLYSKDVLRAVAEDEPMRLSLNGEPLAESRMGSDDKLSVEVVNEAQAEKLRAIWEECSAAPEPPAVDPTAIRWREFL